VARYGRKDGLVVGSGEDPALSAAHQGGDAFQEVGTIPVQPVEQDAREVEVDADGGVAFQDVDERPVGVAEGVLEDEVEVADGLVGMDRPQQSRGARGGMLLIHAVTRGRR
jgi:hypothetical protein